MNKFCIISSSSHVKSVSYTGKQSAEGCVRIESANNQYLSLLSFSRHKGMTRIKIAMTHFNSTVLLLIQYPDVCVFCLWYNHVLESSFPEQWVCEGLCGSSWERLRCNSKRVPWLSPAAPGRFFPQQHPSPDALPTGGRQNIENLISSLCWFNDFALQCTVLVCRLQCSLLVKRYEKCIFN